jgi:hypothetical protein
VPTILISAGLVKAFQKKLKLLIDIVKRADIGTIFRVDSNMNKVKHPIIAISTIRDWNRRRIELGSIAKLAKELGRSAESLRVLFKRHGLYTGKQK